MKTSVDQNVANTLARFQTLSDIDRAEADGRYEEAEQLRLALYRELYKRPAGETFPAIPPEAKRLIDQGEIKEASARFPHAATSITLYAAQLAAQSISKMGDAPFWNQRGVDLSRAGKYGRAEQAFVKAITENPRYAPAHVNRGLLLASVNRRPEALADFRKALQINPADERTRSMLRDAEAGRWEVFKF
jgi:tetratricopeptide (TPR) repeat protein